MIALLVLFLTVQYMYDPVEGLYWHPGASAYTFYYALGLWMDGLLLRMICHTALHRRLLCFVPAIIPVSYTHLDVYKRQVVDGTRGE